MSADVGDIKGRVSIDASGVAKGMSAANESVASFAKEAKKMALEMAIEFASVAGAMELISKGVEFVRQGTEDAAALGSGPARELGETFEKVGLATRQLGADVMSDLAPALNSLISYFTDGADFGKILADVARFIGDSFRDLVQPLVMAAGAIKGLISGGTFESAMQGAATAAAKLAEHGESFAGSMKTAVELAGQLAHMQSINAKMNIGREANRMQDQFENMTGNRRLDAFAGATAGFGNFQDALHKWKQNMDDAADLTARAAVEEAYGSKKNAESLRLEADQATKAADANMLAVEAFRALKEKALIDARELRMAAGAQANANALSEGQRAIDMGRRQRDFGNIGAPQTAVLSQMTSGFKDFDDALKREAAALRSQEQLLSAAKMMEMRATQLSTTGKQEDADAALRSAENLKLLAQQQGAAALAADDAAKAFATIKQEVAEQFAGALKVGAAHITANLGELGKVINDVAQGWQQGGIWGALIALVMDLLSMVKGWKDIQAIADGQLKMALKDMASGLNSVISGLKPLMGAIESIMKAIHGILNPILELIGGVLKDIAPVIEFIGIALQNIGSSIKPLIQVIGQIITPLLQALEPILRVVAEAFLGIRLAADYLNLGFQEFVNWIDGFFGKNNGGGIATAIDAVNADMKAMQDLWNVGLGGLADQSAAAAEQLGKTADAAASVTEQLLNVPEGFKVALAAFDATQPVPGSSSSTMTKNTDSRNRFLATGAHVAAGLYNRKKP